MRRPTSQELRSLEETLDWIRPIIDLEYVYVEEDNSILIGDNFIIRAQTQVEGDVSWDVFNLIYGESFPGETEFDLSRWEEEDIATSKNIFSLLPLFVSSLFHRKMEERIYSNVVLAHLGE